MVKIIVDHREKKIIGELNRICSEIEVTCLPVGDILILKENSKRCAIIIERKTIFDFVSSIRSNRIWNQLLRLMQAEYILGHKVDHKIVIVQGSFKEYFEQIPRSHKQVKRDHRAFWRFMMLAVVDIIFIYRIPLLFFSNNEQLYKFLKILMARNIDRNDHWIFGSRAYNKRSRLGLPLKNNQLFLLCSIPLINYTLSKRLLGDLKSIANIAQASVDELKQVKGIGKKKAEIIFDIFHNEKNITK